MTSIQLPFAGHGEREREKRGVGENMSCGDRLVKYLRTQMHHFD
jgi:hypothetical protein